MASQEITVQPVTTRREVKDYVLFPFRLYRDDPHWVPPLIGDRMKHFDPHHNPFYEHAKVQMLRARRGRQTVGVITAIADSLHVQVWNEAVGYFGEFEALDDFEVAQALFDTARAWLADQGCEVMRGPLNMNINEEVGLLVDGFDGPPAIMMTYNPPYYPALIESYGFQKAKDLYAYKIDLHQFGTGHKDLPAQVTRMAQVARERYKVRMRHIDLKRIDEEVELIKPIYRKAWAKNWGAIPMTDAEFGHLAHNLVQIADERFTYLAFIGDEPVGVFIAVPDFCQVAKHLGGRLFPFGYLKVLWYRRKINGLRVLIMGVLEQHRLKGVEALFYEEGLFLARQKGIDWGEMSWILEDNYKMRRGIEAVGGRIYRTYRLYDIPTRGLAASTEVRAPGAPASC